MTRTEGQLALLSAGTEARREAVRGEAEAIARGVDWTTLSGLLRARKLLGTLGPRIVALSDTPDPLFVEEVEQAVESGRRHGSFLQLLTGRLTAMLGEEGIVSAPLKGPQLSEAIYGDPGRRLSSDIDLLIAPERLAAAVEVVRGLGYESPTDFVYESGLPLLHFALLHPRDELPPVELHWRVHWYEERFAKEMLLPPAGGEASWRPEPAAELVELLLFYARDGFVDLRLAVDLSAWWDAFGGRLQAGAMAELLTSYPELERAATASLKVSECVVGLPASRILGAAPKLTVRDRLAIRLADPNPTARRSQLHADMGFIDGLLTPTRDLGKFARRQIFLPRGVFHQYARHADFRARSPLDYALRVLARFGIAGLRALRRPEYV
ncbi:MAG TPA: nucleotidyltransferase family protein [Solirubrobacterales bacterium]